MSLTGFPLTAGFISKDAIIEATYAAHTWVGNYAFVLTLIAAVLTSFYSWRLMFLAFEGRPREPKEVLEHAHEPPWTMGVPLMILAIGSLLAGGLFFHLFIGSGQEEFWRGSLVTHAEHHEVPLWVVAAPTLAMAAGFAVAWYFYITNPLVPFGLAKRFRGLHQFLLNAWYFDALYDAIFVRPAKKGAAPLVTFTSRESRGGAGSFHSLSRTVALPEGDEVQVELKLGTVYNPVEVQRAREKLKDHYEEEGYFEVKITPETESFPDGDVKVVFASSRQVYGRPQYLPVDEKHPTRPVDVNGINKLAGEWYHLLYSEVYGVRAAALRLTNTYGPGMRVKDARQTFLGIWIRRLLEGEPLAIYGDGRQLRDFNYVDDCVEALLLAATHEKAYGRVFNLGSREVVSLADLARLMTSLGWPGRFEHVEFPPERKAIDITLHHTRGDKNMAARLLGIATRTIYRHLDSVTTVGVTSPSSAPARTRSSGCPRSSTTSGCATWPRACPAR